jgi:guanylate kinase
MEHAGGLSIRPVDTLRAPTRTGGLLVVLSGPSGVGKDSIVAKLQGSGVQLHNCVTATTRPPREGEVDGVSYFFHDLQDFNRMVSSGELLEWAMVHGHYYGTPKKAVLDTLAAGNDVLLNVDVQGGASVRKVVPDAVLVYVAPPSAEELARRLRDRGTDSLESIQLRLENAQSEAEAASAIYDYEIPNDDLATAAYQLKCILVAERCRIVRKST